MSNNTTIVKQYLENLSKIDLALLWIQKDFEENGQDTGLARMFSEMQNIPMQNYIEYANKGLASFYERVDQKPEFLDSERNSIK